MKKLLSLLAALMLLVLPVMSMAETAEVTAETEEVATEATEYATYVDPEGRYEFQYPSDWNLLAKDTIDALLEVATSLGNEQLAQTVESVKPQLEQMDMIMLMSADMLANINIVPTDANGITDVSALLPAADTLVSQMAGQLEGLELVAEPSVETYGDHQAFVLQYAYTMAEQSFIGMQLYIIGGSNLYVMTLTTPAETDVAYGEAMGNILGSIAFN